MKIPDHVYGVGVRVILILALGMVVAFIVLVAVNILKEGGLV